MFLFNKIIFSFIFINFLFFFHISFANIEEEYFKIYKKLDYQKGVYGNASKYADLIYEYEGVTNNFRLYIDNTVQNQELILWNLDENWNENRIFVNKKVQEFWGFVNNYGIFIIYKRSSNIYWKIYQTNNGKEIIGGFLTSESILNLALKDVYFASYKKGAFVSLVFYDNLGKQYYYIYYLDVWGRHDLVTKKDNK
ncbi:MAG: hypothetical protein ACK4ZM_00935 [bacterium]